jgi:hypothetical protein
MSMITFRSNEGDAPMLQRLDTIDGVYKSRPAQGWSTQLQTRWVVCSPHFDDAVLNCWSVLDRDPNCAVVNVFTGAPSGPFTSWIDQSSGASSSAARMDTRALEDRAALSVAGKSAIDLGMLEVQYRLRQSRLLHLTFRHVPPLRFVMLRLPFLRPLLYSTPTPEPERIADAIVAAVPGASHFCVPAGIGGHRDHVLVRQAGVALAARGMAVRIYADLPYAKRHGWPRWIGKPEGERKNDRASAFWARHLEDLREQLGDPVKAAVVVELTAEESARKASAFSHYTSQIASLNSGRTRGWLQDDRAFAYEVYWELRPARSAPASP